MIWLIHPTANRVAGGLLYRLLRVCQLVSDPKGTDWVCVSQMLVPVGFTVQTFSVLYLFSLWNTHMLFR